MSTTTNNEEGNKVLFWGCFIALVTTAFAFISRMFLLGTWGEEFGLDDAQAGRLMGIGIWPFAVSIIGFSLIIDRIGYKVAMYFAFVSHIAWAVLAISAFFISQNGDKDLAFKLIYWGSLICALGNGTVEAFINPVVATMYNKEKTKWLNILHAGWPGGLVIAGMITIFIDSVPWWIKVGMIVIPAVVYFMMLVKCKFPENERVASGVSYKEMLGEFGVLGAAIVGFLVTLQLIDFASQGGAEVVSSQKTMFIAIGVAIAAGFGFYTKSLGRPLLFILVLIHMPLAVTEIGTDGWIENILKGVAENKFHAGWVLVYTSAIMMILRFYAGPIVKKLQPIRLLALSSFLAIIGLYTLSITTGMAIFLAATIYGLGKTFLWPTMLGVVSEQCPRGGAVALNAISGIGMLAVGTLGFPYIGTLKEAKSIESVQANAAIVETVPGLVKDGEFQAKDQKKIYEIIKYSAFSDVKVDDLIKELPDKEKEEIKDKIKVTKNGSGQKALADMAYSPLFMLICYLGLLFHFKSKGGYKPVMLGGGGDLSEGDDEDEPADSNEEDSNEEDSNEESKDN